jgi:DNA repair ATPase RecN
MTDTERIIQLEQELSEVKADRDAWRESALNWHLMAASRREQLNRIEQLQNQVKEVAEANLTLLTGSAVEVAIPGETGEEK